MIRLVFLTGAIRGGWATYHAHLAHGLMLGGIESYFVQLHTVAKTEGRTERPFGRGLVYRTTTIDFLRQKLREGDAVHITAADPKRVGEVSALMQAGATITIHDPNELKNGMQNVVVHSDNVVVIRQKMLDYLPRARFIPHPYVRLPTEQRGREVKVNAVAFSRLDFDKGTHYIAAANREIEQGFWCWLYGWEHRPYAQHKLSKVDPNWREYHGGKWGVEDLWYGVRLAEMANMVIDMTTIVGDGGGTQYTHLEGLDGCDTLVLNSGWLTGTSADDELLRVANFLDPTVPRALADVLRGELQFPVPISHRKNVEKFFVNHDAIVRARQTIYERR
jgi:hypothetical protein